MLSKKAKKKNSGGGWNGDPVPPRKSGSRKKRHLIRRTLCVMSIRNIYHEMTSFNSLRVAEGEVTKGKGEKQEVLAFEDNLEDNLHDISNGLRHGQVPKVHYKSFYVYSPKVRKVIYIDYASKVIQRSAYDYLNPRLNKTFISDTYACIPGKGQHKAMLKVKRCMEETSTKPGDWYYYKFDVAKFFYRIDHETLMAMLHHKVDDRRAVELLEYYIFDTIETLLTICREQNAKLTELDAVIAADRIEEAENKYIRKVYHEGGEQNE